MDNQNGRKRIADNALVALCLLIAESNPKEKDVIVLCPKYEDHLIGARMVQDIFTLSGVQLNTSLNAFLITL